MQSTRPVSQINNPMAPHTLGVRMVENGEIVQMTPRQYALYSTLRAMQSLNASRIWESENDRLWVAGLIGKILNILKEEIESCSPTNSK